MINHKKSKMTRLEMIYVMVIIFLLGMLCGTVLQVFLMRIFRG